MNAAVGQFVSFHCVVKDCLGRVISSSYNQNVYTGDSPNGQLVGFSRGLRDLKVGERRTIFVKANEAYGFYDPEKTKEVVRDEFPADFPTDLRVGDVVLIGSGDTGAMTEFRVTELDSDKVTLDSNHPLAGQDLIFEIEATAVRSEEESPSGADSVYARGMGSRLQH
jgi:FKBP-type peptidyl-prolyl cis-trans isomerase SlyD